MRIKETVTARDNQNVCTDLMNNPSTDKFYQLNWKNSGNKGQNVECLIVYGKEMSSADD